MAKSKLVEKFELARDDLGLVIVAPYEVTLPSGNSVRADLLLKHFGGRLGMLVFATAGGVAPYGDDLYDLGYGISVLSEPDEVKYDRASFIEMLSDWGWTGSDSDKPAWLKPPPEDE
jgi:hypothetical protein